MESLQNKGEGKRRTAHDRREAIIGAARTLFSQNGFHGTGMAEIARVSGILIGQIYRDFASKEDIIAAIVHRDIDTIMSDQELGDPAIVSDGDRFRAWLHQFIAKPPDPESLAILADILAEARRNPRVQQIVRSTHDRVRGSLVEAVRHRLPAWSSEEASLAIADNILTASGALLYRDLMRLPRDPAMVSRIVAWAENELAKGCLPGPHPNCP